MKGVFKNRLPVALVALAVLAAALVALPQDSFARAGGGQSSSHGESSGSYGGSRSYGGGPTQFGYSGGSYGGTSGCLLASLLLGNMIPGWLIVLIFLVVGFAIFIKIARAVGGAARGGPTDEPPQYREPEEPSEPGSDYIGDNYVPISQRGKKPGSFSIEELREKDPAFSERAFLDKAQAIFFELQKAWMRRDLSPIRPYVTDGVFTRWQVLIDQYKRDRQINVVKDPVINNARVARVTEDGEYDSIAVEMNASMADAMVAENDPNRVISGSLTEHRPFTEFWVFVRKTGTGTRTKASPRMDKCPNCGAPLTISAAGNCNYCGALVYSPEYDWVLDQIIQSEEWV